MSLNPNFEIIVWNIPKQRENQNTPFDICIHMVYNDFKNNLVSWGVKPETYFPKWELR
jgi:hypothetical protein